MKVLLLSTKSSFAFRIQMLRVRVNNFFILSQINIFFYPKCTIIFKNYSVANYLGLHSGNMTSYRVMINMGNHILAIVIFVN